MQKFLHVLLALAGTILFFGCTPPIEGEPPETTPPTEGEVDSTQMAVTAAAPFGNLEAHLVCIDEVTGEHVDIITTTTCDADAGQCQLVNPTMVDPGRYRAEIADSTVQACPTEAVTLEPVIDGEGNLVANDFQFDISAGVLIPEGTFARYEIDEDGNQASEPYGIQTIKSDCDGDQATLVIDDVQLYILEGNTASYAMNGNTANIESSDTIYGENGAGGYWVWIRVATN